MATGGESKIDTKLFIATAEAIQTVETDLEQCFSEWDTALQSLRADFMGDTADNLKNTADNVMSSKTVLMRMIEGYRKTLNEMAGIYDKVEQTVSETSKSLSFDKQAMV